MIVVAGATGILGSAIVERLRSRGHPVRALVRSTSAPDKTARLETAGAETHTGDLRDPASLDALCAGATAVISTVSIILTAQPGDSFSDTDGAGNVALIDAAARAGVEHFVFVSFTTDHMPDSPLIRAKRAVEDHLRASGMTYTILQPGLFMESWLGPFLFADLAARTAKVYGSTDYQISYVSVADVAEVAVQSLMAPIARNATIPFGGPQPLSQREAVRLFEQALGQSLNVIEIPEAALEGQWSTADDPFQKTFAGLMLGVARGFGQLPAPPSDFQLHMRSVDDFASATCASATLSSS